MKKYRISGNVFIKTFNSYVHIKNVSRFYIFHDEFLKIFDIRLETFNKESLCIDRFDDFEAAENFLENLLDEIED